MEKVPDPTINFKMLPGCVSGTLKGRRNSFLFLFVLLFLLLSLLPLACPAEPRHHIFATTQLCFGFFRISPRNPSTINNLVSQGKCFKVPNHVIKRQTAHFKNWRLLHPQTGSGKTAKESHTNPYGSRFLFVSVPCSVHECCNLYIL